MNYPKISSYHLNFNIDCLDRKESMHHGLPCFIYIVKGRGTLKVNEEIFPLDTGDCFLAPIGDPISYWAKAGEGWKYIWINFNGPMFQEILSKTAFSAATPVCHCTQEQQQGFQDLLARKHHFHGRDYYDALGMMVRLCASFIENFPSEDQMLADNSIQSIRSFIQNNLSRPDLDVKLLMQVTGLGRTTLYNKFKKAGYKSVSSYIQGMRIGQAKFLLRSTELPINQIAFVVGFEDPLYFSRILKKEIGLSPTGYRKYIAKHKADR